jgi:hypothetical protein
MTRSHWSNSLFVKTSLPAFAFVVVGWLGLSQLMESKMRIKVSAAGAGRLGRTWHADEIAWPSINRMATTVVRPAPPPPPPPGSPTSGRRPTARRAKRAGTGM